MTWHNHAVNFASAVVILGFVRIAISLAHSACGLIVQLVSKAVQGQQENAVLALEVLGKQGRL